MGMLDFRWTRTISSVADRYADLRYARHVYRNRAPLVFFAAEKTCRVDLQEAENRSKRSEA
jgi:hypothetical protein